MMAKKETKKQREFAVNKAVSVLTENNPINMFMLGELSDKLEAMDSGDLALIIVSAYSPCGNARWQDVLDGTVFTQTQIDGATVTVLKEVAA